MLIDPLKCTVSAETERQSTDYGSHAGRVRDQQRAGGQGVRQEEPQEFQNGESLVSRQ